jgi:hypothetical protein
MVRLALILALLVAGTTLARVSPAGAQPVRTVGPYTVAVWFASTPVYPEEGNALYIQVTRADGTPVLGLEQTLRLRVGLPNQATETMPLSPERDRPGVYRVDLLLPRAAPYSMALLGRIEDTTVHELFVTGRDLDKVIVRERQYPKGSAYVVAFTFGLYLVGLAYLVARGALHWHRRRSALSR